MPIGKVPQSLPMSRKSSANESSSLDSTIDSRMSNSELLPMELLKVNYVHQCKQAMMRKSNEPPATPHLNNPARFIGYRRQAPTQAARPVRIASTLSPNSARKPLPPIPPPTVESWLLLSKQPQKTTTVDSDCCCSQSACSCSDSNSDVTEASTVTPDCEKSQSWNYRNVRPANASGIKSRADRIARIEKSHCELPSSSNKESSIECVACLRQPQQVASTPNRMSPRSRIPKPVAPRTDTGPYNEANLQLQRRVQQLFQQEVVLQSHSEAPRWMFQQPGGSNSNTNRQPELAEDHQSPRLQHKAKLERVHIRKKRQTLQIVNQLTAERTRDSTLQDTKGNASYKNQKHTPTPKSTMVREERMKRSSMECCSDSGVSSSNDTKEQQTKQNNMQQRDEKCLDCVDTLESKIPDKPNPKQADPNDVQNFAKKNLIKATTNELLTAAAVQAKLCNIEREKKLNKLNQRSEPMTSTITISIDDNWVQESCIDPCDDYMETDSLMLTPRPISHSSNSVKIFVCSDGSRGSGATHEQSKSLCPVDLSSRNSMSSSGCGESSRDNTSVCDSEQDCCLCSGNQRGSSINCASNDCCHTIGGVFWNNACYEVEAELGANCCCSVSSCDEDDCSYYEGKFRVELDGIQARPSKVPLRSNKLLRKVGTTNLTALSSYF